MAIGKEELFAFRVFGKFRLNHKAANGNNVSLLANRHEFFIHFRTENISNALPQRCYGLMENSVSIVTQFEVNIGMCKCYAFELVVYMSQLHLIRLQKFAPSRYVIK